MILLAGVTLFAMTGMASATVQTGYVVTTDTADRLQVSYGDASAPFPIRVLTAAPDLIPDSGQFRASAIPTPTSALAAPTMPSSATVP